MPELPEVETIRIGLEKYIVGETIESLDVKPGRVFSGDKKQCVGASVVSVERYGKVVSIYLDNDYAFLIHVKLTGQLIYRGPNLSNPPDLSKKVVGGAPGRFTHVVFNFVSGGKLYYNDIRSFGWVKLMKSNEVKDPNGFVGKLGPEPFRDLTYPVFSSILLSTKRPVKIVLMDQEKMGGIGNIYANDALFLSLIDPRRPANSLTVSESRSLYKAILKVLKRGLEYGGASELSFVTPDGTEGQYQMHTLAYGHEGEICSECNEDYIQKTQLGGRGTYFCPSCQK